MLNAEITIERSPEIVWAYFTEPRNWEKWWGGGLKAAQWREGGKLEWALGGSSPIEAITPGRMIQIAGSWMSTTFTFEPKGSGKTVVRMQESSPKGGASFSDGGASHLAQLSASLKKLKEHIESETKQNREGKMSTAEYTCPHCGSELQGTALITVKVSMQVGVVDFQTNCSSCGRVISKKDILGGGKNVTAEVTPFLDPTLEEQKPTIPLPAPEQVTGSTQKTCPQCAEKIQLEASMCRFCGHRFSESEIQALKQQLEEEARETQRLAGEEAARRKVESKEKSRRTWARILAIVGVLAVSASGLLFLILILSSHIEDPAISAAPPTLYTYLCCPLPLLIAGGVLLFFGIKQLRSRKSPET